MFAGLYKEAGCIIPNEKRGEFKIRIEKLYQAGGMMEYEWINLFEKEVLTIRKAVMHEEGIDFCYNYFEDEFWESAGYSADGSCVRSHKIGWSHFHKTVIAAYVLEGLYINGTAVVIVDGEPQTAPEYIGWINYLFKEKYGFENKDPWKLFEIMHRQEDNDRLTEEINWEGFVREEYGLLGYFEIRAVRNGTKAAMDELAPYFEEKDGEEDKEKRGIHFWDCCKIVKNLIREFKENTTISEEEQVALLTEMFRNYYKEDSLHVSIEDKYEDVKLKNIRLFAVLSDVPAFVFKVIAEMYGREFWELWNPLRGVARRKIRDRRKQADDVVEAVTTCEMFGQQPDDMLLYWTEDGDIHFSEKLQEWFCELQRQFDQIMREGVCKDSPIKWILDLMEYADEEYYHIYTFSEFFEETIEKLPDMRYLALWEIYDRMLHRRDFQEAGHVIFVPKETKKECAGYHHTEKTCCHRLIKPWSMISKEKRNNIARVTLRRYMALIANIELRKKVFGF